MAARHRNVRADDVHHCGGLTPSRSALLYATRSVIERRPVVTFEPPKWESDYRELQEQVEKEEPSPVRRPTRLVGDMSRPHQPHRSRGRTVLCS